MALLLAKKLTNQITRLAEQAGLPLEFDLANFYNEGERRAAGCKGEVRNLETGKRVSVLSSEACPDRIRLEIISKSSGAYPEGMHNVAPERTATHIIKLLTPVPLTHDILASAGVTNLSDLAKNPMLAIYLCDVVTNTDTWTRARDNLTDQLRQRGLYNFAADTSYPYRHEAGDSAVSMLRNILWQDLAGDCDYYHMVYHQLLAYHDVVPSETAAGRIAYYQDDAKRKAGIRTPIRVRKYLSKFFGECMDADKLERVAKSVDDAMTTSDKWDVRLFTDDNLDGWSDAYYHIKSCMNTQSTSYGVGEHETYRCYCTHAMTDGAKSSGLTLAVLYQGGKPVARAITYEDDDNGKCYVHNYGDDRLVRWLDDNDYMHQKWLPNGTHLWTESYISGDDTEYLSPYVDGDDDDAKAELTRIDGQPYWVISGDGVILQNCCGYTSAYPLTCDFCGDNISHGDEYYRVDMHGNDITLCCDCEEDNCFTVNDEEDTYVSDSDLRDLVETNSQGYYTQDYLDDNDLVLTGDGYVMHERGVDLCVHSDEYYSISDFTDLSDEPELVRDTWAGYINDNDRVLNHLYWRDGTYIEEIDARVHAAHTSDIRHRLETQAS